MLKGFKNILACVFLFVFYKGIGQEYNFWNYTVQNGLVGAHVNTVFQDNLGFLWVGTESGVSKYDGTTFFNYDKFDNLNTNSITHIIQDSANVLWFGHRDGSITSYEKNKFSPVIYESDSIINFALNNTGDLLVTTKRSIFFLENKEKQLIPIYNTDTTEYFISTKQITNQDWLTITNKSINVYAIENNIPKLINEIKTPVNTSYFISDYNKFFLASHEGEVLMLDYDFNVEDKIYLNEKINHIESKDNRLFVSTDKGVFVLAKDSTFKVLKKLFTDNIEIQKTYLDKENILWMATTEKGLLAIPKNHFSKYTYESKLGNLLSYSKKSSALVLIFEKGIVKTELSVLGSNYNVVSKFNNSINTALLTDKNEIWYGTDKGLFLRFSNSVVEYQFKEFKEKKINDLCLFNGDILIATDTDLFIYKPSTNKVSSYTLQNELTKFGVKSFNVLEDEIYGVGKGNIIKISTEEVSFLFNKNDQSVSELEFTSLSKSNSKILIGTQGKGIYTYRSTQDFYNLTEKLNIPYRYIISLQQVNDSIIWFTTKLGVVKCNIKTNEYNLYEQRYLGELNFISKTPIIQNENCFFLADKGLVLAELVLFKTKSVNDLQITNFQVSGVDRDVNKDLELNYGNYPIKIDYESVSLKDKSYFQYKLVGYSNYWSEASHQKSITFLNLTPGRYSFKVRTVNSKNNKIGIEKELNFVINIPFWRTTKFLGIVSLGVVLLFLSIYFFRILSLRVQKRKLEKQVEKKTFQLSLQKKQLEQFSYSLSHDLKNPVNNIKGLVEILADNKSEEVISMLSQSTEVLENKILEALNSIKRTQANTQEIKQVVFSEVFAKVEKSLMMLIKESKATLLIDFSVKDIQYEETLIESIMYNLISNAIKYKHPDRLPIINIYTEQINDLVRFSITDNGLGLDLAKEKENLFSIFKRVHTNGEGTGIGLYMIKQMVEINGGSIDVESEIGEGTTFHVYLKPLKEK